MCAFPHIPWEISCHFFVGGGILHNSPWFFKFYTSTNSKLLSFLFYYQNFWEILPQRYFVSKKFGQKKQKRWNLLSVSVINPPFSKEIEFYLSLAFIWGIHNCCVSKIKKVTTIEICSILSAGRRHFELFRIPLEVKNWHKGTFL